MDVDIIRYWFYGLYKYYNFRVLLFDGVNFYFTGNSSE